MWSTRDAVNTGTVLTKTIAKRRVLELEIAIIDEHELTLPQTHTLGTGLTGGSRSGGGRSRWRMRGRSGTGRY